MKVCNIRTETGVSGCVVTDGGLIPFEKLGFSGTVQELIESGPDAEQALKDACRGWRCCIVLMMRRRPRSTPRHI